MEQTPTRQTTPVPAAGPAHSTPANTQLVSARWTAPRNGVPAPATPDTYYTEIAETPAAQVPQTNTDTHRAGFLSVADVRAQAAGEFAHARPSSSDAADAAPAPGSPSFPPSRTFESTVGVACPSAARGPLGDGTGAIGGGQEHWSLAGPSLASGDSDDSASDSDSESVAGTESTDATTAIDDEEEDWSEDDSEEYETDSEEDDEQGDDDDEEDDEEADDEDEDEQEGDDDDDEDDEEEDEDAQEDDEEDVPHRFRVTGHMHRWLGCARQDY